MPRIMERVRCPLSRRGFISAFALACMLLGGLGRASASGDGIPASFHLTPDSTVGDFLSAFCPGWETSVSKATFRDAGTTALAEGRIAAMPDGDIFSGGMLALSASYSCTARQGLVVSSQATYGGTGTCRFSLVVVETGTDRVLHASWANGAQTELLATCPADEGNAHFAIAAVVFDDPHKPVLCTLRRAVWRVDP